MENKVRIKGGDTVQLKSGEIVKVVDIKNNYIIDDYCPTCDEELYATSNYCPHCGQKLDWSDDK